MIISAQVSIYPLGTDDLGAAIDLALCILGQHDVDYEVGTMSTLVVGELAQVQQALDDMFAQIAARYAVVMQSTLSNTCPIKADAAGVRQ